MRSVAGPFVHQGREYGVRYARLALDGQTILLTASDSASVASFWSVPATDGRAGPMSALTDRWLP